MSGEDDERGGMMDLDEPNLRRRRHNDDDEQNDMEEGDQHRNEEHEDDEDEDEEEEEGDEDDPAAGEKKKQQKKVSKERKEPNPHEGKLRFRNYVPRDALLRELRIEPAPLPSMVGEINRKLILMDAQRGEDLLALAPKKPNWDLKRDIEKKLDVLEKRTQRAIVLLLRKKLEAGGAEPSAIEGAEAQKMLAHIKQEDETQQEGAATLGNID